MISRRLVLTSILASAIAGCTASSGSSPAPPDPPTAGPTDAATPLSPSSSPTPRPSPTPTPVLVPPKPTGVTFEEQGRELAGGGYESTSTVTWQAPRVDGVEIRVFGVTECLSMPADPPAPGSGPCLVVHIPLPASVRVLLARAPAADGAVRWTSPVTYSRDGSDECRVGWFGPDHTVYRAVVLAAYSASDRSIFAIAHPGLWSEPGPGDLC